MVLALAFVIPLAASATPPPWVIRTGVYENWLIGYNAATDTVTGHFSSGAGSTKDSTCEFYFVGDLVSVRGQIKAFVPDKPKSTYSGRLYTPFPMPTTVEFEEDVCPGMTTPSNLAMTRFYQWKEVRVAKSPNTRLFESPDPNSLSHRKLGSGDAVGVVESIKGWLKVDYLNSQGGASGWAHEENFYPVHAQQNTASKIADKATEK